MLIPNLKTVLRLPLVFEIVGKPKNTFNHLFQIVFVLFSCVFFDADFESEIIFLRSPLVIDL